MTKIAVLSDIHSNLPALEAVLDDLAQFKVDHIVVAGDVVNWGPFSAQVMERVTREGCAVIRGNNELYLVDWQTPRAPARWQHYTIPPFTIRQLGDRWMAVISAWPDTITLRFRDAPTLRIVHGSPRSPFESIFPTSTESEILVMLEGVEETTIIAGHTHLPMDRRVGHWHILNPGSVGMPLSGIPGVATYMLLDGSPEGWHGTLRHVRFDYEPVLREFERLHFVEECGVVAYLVMEEYRTARLQVYPFLQWHRQICLDAPYSMALLESFSMVNKMDYTPPEYRVNL
jgi:predicted phosphodiesterase